MANKERVSDEMLAAYLDGNTSEEETRQVLQVLPIMQKVTISGENICAILCEIFILHRRQLPYDEE